MLYQLKRFLFFFFFFLNFFRQSKSCKKLKLTRGDPINFKTASPILMFVFLLVVDKMQCYRPFTCSFFSSSSSSNFLLFGSNEIELPIVCSIVFRLPYRKFSMFVSCANFSFVLMYPGQMAKLECQLFLPQGQIKKTQIKKPSGCSALQHSQFSCSCFAYL